MSGTVGSGAQPRVREAYSFACLNCGYGWEQAYEIEHHVDTFGREYVTYLADGTSVPSPLTSPACGNCGGEHVRIMRSGRVAGVEAVEPWHLAREHRPHHWSALRFLHRHRETA
ncbi:hypothetical protein [Streptomyces sp. NPDC021224]|uniref:hypothetical protein n=1 Tax=unclassified Streptomyces TaxID=2593676 RepID=UPI003790B48E